MLITFTGSEILCHLQQRFQDFPKVGAPTLQGAPTYNFPKFFQKMHEIERIWTPAEGAHVPCTPLRSATVFVVQVQSKYVDNLIDRELSTCDALLKLDFGLQRPLLAFIDKYGVLTNQWTWLYEALSEVSITKIALWIRVCADDWTAESAIKASNDSCQGSDPLKEAKAERVIWK